MKTNCWLVLGTMIATSAIAQVNTNTLPEIPAPATVAAPAAAESATPEAVAAPEKTAPEKKSSVPKKKKAERKTVKHVKKISEPTMTLVPGSATVVSPNLNVRGQAGLKGEVIGHLKKGDSVTVISQINLDKHALDEPAQWAKIALPSGSKVWVSSHFVDAATKTVTARRLNLRAGPGENYSVIGTIEKGTVVTEVAGKKNWMEIEPPTNAFAFVAAMYLDQSVIPAQPVPATMPETTPVAQAAAPTTTTVAAAQPVVSTPPPATAPAAPASAPAVAMTMEPEPAVVDTNPPPPRVATHEGNVRSSTSLVAPTAYELYDPATGNPIDYLYSPTTNLDLSRYNGAQIIVTGEEGMAARWGATPVMTVQRIYVVNANPPAAYNKIQSPRASQQTISGTQPLQRR